jgi:CRP/FNR family transcriptional regulator
MIKELLKKIEVFQGCDEDILRQIAEISSLHGYDAQSVLHYEAETSHRLLFLVEGLLKVYKIDKFDNEIFLYYVYENTMISELSSLEKDEIRCFSNAEFVQDSQILSIDFEKFKEILQSSNALCYRFATQLILKNHQLQCIINRELVFDATSKVAFMLHNDLKMFNDLKRTEAAFLLHIQPETLSRVLKRLVRNEIIAVDKGVVTICDKDELQAIFMNVG